MSYKYFIAKRYLLSKREANFITVISLVSILGITVGVAALIVVLSVFNGFNSLVTNILVGFDPHLRIQQTATTTQEDYSRLKKFLLQQNDIQGVGSFVNGKAMIVSKNQSKVIFIRGVDGATIDKVSGVKEKIVLGNFDFSDSTKRDIVLGFSLADKLGVITEDTVWIVSPAGSEQALLGFGAPILRSFRIAGIYESNNKEYDGLYGYMSLQSSQRLFQLGSEIHGFEMRLSSIDNAEMLKEKILREFPLQFSVLTWYDLHKDLYSVMKIERWSAFTILCLIIAVATFNLLGSLTMSVIEKTRDIGILKTMGATNKDIVQIFRFEGFLIGIVGVVLGTIIGLIVCYLQIHYQLYALDPTAYIIPALPVEIRVSDLLIIGLATLVLCYISTIYPAKRAANLLPSEAIRWE